MSLVTPEEFQKFQTGDPATFLNSASSLVQRYCGWEIAPREERTFVLDGRGSQHLWLPTLLLVDVVSVKNDGKDVPVEDFDWSSTGWIGLRCGAWSVRASGIEVTCISGYEETPADLAGVIMAVAARGAASPTSAYLQRAGAVQMQWQADSSSAIGGAFLENEKAVLDLYTLPARQ